MDLQYLDQMRRNVNSQEAWLGILKFDNYWLVECHQREFLHSSFLKENLKASSSEAWKQKMVNFEKGYYCWEQPEIKAEKQEQEELQASLEE